jgi:cytochrome P450
LDRYQAQMDRGIPNSGLIRALFEQRQGLSEEKQSEKFLDDRCIAYQAMSFMEAGADTTSIVLISFTMAMLLKPHVMRKGQQAIDNAVPDTRLPTFDDLPSMNYIN